ncbi:MAG: tryptophan synthase subunit beta [Gemmatimonadetes bacterium]|nr:tryptophan synthase subunit beta [Gemmatimonadota bacterium]
MSAVGRFGAFGGRYVPEILMPALEELDQVFQASRADPEFQAELSELLATFAGRPTPLHRCRRFGAPATVWLKREDLLHGGAHKTNQALAQGLLARRLGKARLIAETGAGQHGVATAMAGACLGLATTVYMGVHDVERQRQNVDRMRLYGATVHGVATGGGTLKGAINEALRDWSASYRDTHYLLGTAAGPHPYPTMVREFQRVIGDEARTQCLACLGRLPDAVIACVGGGSNAIGTFAAFLDDPVALVGVEPAGRGLDTPFHGAAIARGRDTVLHGALTKVLADEDGQILESHSVSAGLDYPAVGPEHAHLAAIGRVHYRACDDRTAVATYRRFSRDEGIIPALESAHALAEAARLAESRPDWTILVTLSGRGDKDLATVAGFPDPS